MRILTIGTLGVAAMLAAGGSAAAASGPSIGVANLASHCHGKAAANYRTAAARINVMGASEALDNSWVVVGTTAIGKGQSDFMCTYDTKRRFIELKRLD